MKFYNRENELKLLKEIEFQSKTSSKMSFIVGRRRIGKTTLIKESYKNSKLVYFFVSKKNEPLLCEEFITSSQTVSEIKFFGKFTNFRDIFAYLMEVSKQTPFTLVIDEFQELGKINSSIYSEIQNIWDSNKNDSKMNLVLCGSIYSMMKRIFENNKEPLFGRADKKIYLKRFNVAVLKEILTDYNPKASPEDILAFFIITGGIAKYAEILISEKAFTFQEMIDYVFSSNSLFLEEGKNLLIEEFGKEYATYFSILSLISNSKTSRPEIESILEKDLGGFLDKLENEYSIIKKVKPILSKPLSRTQKYLIDDNFFNFWFKYIFTNKSAVEIESFEILKTYVKEDFKTYSGRFLEKYFIDKLALSGKYTEIGTYWETGNENEIDIVAINKFEKKALIAEVKLNSEKISIASLQHKAKKLVKELAGYDIEFRGFSLKDM